MIHNIIVFLISFISSFSLCHLIFKVKDFLKRRRLIGKKESEVMETFELPCFENPHTCYELCGYGATLHFDKVCRTLLLDNDESREILERVKKSCWEYQVRFDALYAQSIEPIISLRRERAKKLERFWYSM